MRRGICLSFLVSTDHECMIFLYLKKGNNESGNKTLFINTISSNNFFIAKGRYPNSVGAENIIAIL
jgi:hypothetical protein